MKNKIILCITTGMLLLLLCTACGNSASATSMYLMRTGGRISVEDGEGKSLSPEENMSLYSGYQMETYEESHAWFNLDDVKLAKMDSESEVEIRKDGKKLELWLNAGNLYFHVMEPLEEEESLEIRTSTMAVGIRGTCGWVSLADATHMTVHILEGAVECTVTDTSGKSKTASVSGGQMAEFVISEDGTAVITVTQFKESEIVPFVLEELKDDEELCEEIRKASGLEILTYLESGLPSGEEQGTKRQDENSGEPGEDSISENAGAAEKLRTYLDTELALQYGYADLNAKERLFPLDSPSGEGNYWTGVKGIADAEICDLDGDGTDELLVVMLNEQDISLCVYEMENDTPVRRAEVMETRWGDTQLYDVVLSMAKGDGVQYLLLREEVSGGLADFYTADVKLYRYDGEKFYTPLAILQTAGGSIDFEYTAYEYDGDGNQLSEETVYSFDLGYDRAHCYERVAGLFGKYGLVLHSESAPNDEEDIFDSLTVSEGYRELLHLTMRADFQMDGVLFRFNN